MPIRKGDKAIGFTLPAGPGEPVDIARHLGKEKVVVLFFPLAFSPVCTKEMCGIRDSWGEWETLQAKVFGISVDSPFVTDRFRAEMKIPFPILSDFNKDVSARYGALHEEIMGLKGVSKRAAFVIDASGTVIYDWISDDPSVMPNFEEIKAALAGPTAGT